jgi:NADP-dependent 3-hydroxy acid dehydrogenase YdfG
MIAAALFKLPGSQRKNNMNEEFSAKTLLITGATSGIGKATALQFAAAGATVAAVGRNEPALAELKTEIAKLGAECLTLRADLSREEEIEGVVAKTVERFGGIDTLVNAAGHISSGTIETTTPGAWDAMMNINRTTCSSNTHRALTRLDESVNRQRLLS